jgi:hypothetical protein
MALRSRAGLPGGSASYAQIVYASSDIKVVWPDGTSASLIGEPAIAAGTTSQYWRGDKSWQTLNKSAVGLANVDNTADAAKPVSTAQQTALDAKANLTGATFTGAVKTSSPSGGIGYATGAGGFITQTTSKSAAVTLNTTCGQVTMNAAALAAGNTVQFTMNNSAVAAGDRIVCNHDSVGTFGAYMIDARSGTGQITFVVRNLTGGSLSESIIIGFAVIKAVVS